MLDKMKPLPLIVILLLFGCAAQGPASGGPADKKGPVLISIQPLNGSKNISPNQNFTLIFDELLDPVSIPASIIIEPDVDYKLKIRGRRLIISPYKKWQTNEIVRINLSRKIKDYQKNMMAEPIHLIFSRGSEIPHGIIKGKIIGHDLKKLIEVGLYEWPPSTQSTYIQKVEADETGLFQLTGIENGRYTIIALEGVISNIDKQIRKKNYAMLTSSYITISSEENEKNVKMLLSEPLEKLQITSVEMQSQYCSQLTLNNNSKELIIIDSLLSPGDSVFVHLEKTNRLETYQVLEYSFILPEIRDTLAPVLSQSFFESDIFTLIFSEPINLNVNAIVSTEDSVDISIPFSYKNEYSIIIPNIPDTVKKIQILGEHIQDWAGNIFPDSLKILRITRPEIEDELKNGGNIMGFVNYDDNYPIKIEAQKIGSNSKYFVNVNNKKYKFSNLSSGLYKLWGFEEINNLDGEVYNSGIWSPYQRAARFTFYPDTIDVRARWDVEGVNINFE